MVQFLRGRTILGRNSNECYKNVEKICVKHGKPPPPPRLIVSCIIWMTPNSNESNWPKGLIKLTVVTFHFWRHWINCCGSGSRIRMGQAIGRRHFHFTGPPRGRDRDHHQLGLQVRAHRHHGQQHLYFRKGWKEHM